MYKPSKYRRHSARRSMRESIELTSDVRDAIAKSIKAIPVPKYKTGLDPLIIEADGTALYKLTQYTWVSVGPNRYVSILDNACIESRFILCLDDDPSDSGRDMQISYVVDKAFRSNHINLCGSDAPVHNKITRM